LVKIDEYLKWGKFLTPTDIKTGDVVTIIDEGTYFPADQTGFNRPAFRIKIKLQNGDEKLWSINRTTANRFKDAWGDETAKWVGKKVRLEVIEQNVGGVIKKVIYGHPITEDESQSFIESLKKIYGSRGIPTADFERLVKTALPGEDPQTLIERYGLKTEGGKVFLK
jgi:hypothetical protein